MSMGLDAQYVFGTNRTRTICEVLRDINDQFQDDNEDDRIARDLVVNAMLLSKSMVGMLAKFREALRKKALPTEANELGGTISDWLFHDNSTERIREANAIRDKPGYKVGGKFN